MDGCPGTRPKPRGAAWTGAARHRSQVRTRSHDKGVRATMMLFCYAGNVIALFPPSRTEAIGGRSVFQADQCTNGCPRPSDFNAVGGNRIRRAVDQGKALARHRRRDQGTGGLAYEGAPRRTPTYPKTIRNHLAPEHRRRIGDAQKKIRREFQAHLSGSEST